MENIEARSFRGPEGYEIGMIQRMARAGLGGRFVWHVIIGVGMSLAFFSLGCAQQDQASGEGRGCVEPKEVRIASGLSNLGTRWHTDASVEPRSQCAGWTLGLNFAYRRDDGWGGWSGSWAIPSHGHIPRDQTLTAQDQVADAERVFSGFVGTNTQKVVAILSTGKRLAVVPAVVQRKLRQDNVWLRGIKTFVKFYPAGGSVRAARLIDRHGRLIEVREGVDGQFDPAIG